jgi:phosphoribosylformylglycinamidine synthase subunit PurSL
VQIGDPLTQKRVMDLLLEARDLELYSGITDNGAGGLSSSLGEMATLTGGARLDLAKNPTKYPGLKPFELMISESQERMSLSIEPSKCPAFLDLCTKRGVSASVLGEFTDSGFFDVYYHDQRVAYLDLHFLHKGLPAMKLKAHWPGQLTRQEWMPKRSRPAVDSQSYEQVLLNLLANPNIASKESLVRCYDHEVQGATIVKPFMGDDGHGPMDAGAIWLGIHGGDPEGVLVISNGLAPRLSLVDPYMMAIAAVDEAVRNAVVTGANPDKLCLLDNFCWPDPVLSPKNTDGDIKLGRFSSHL